MNLWGRKCSPHPTPPPSWLLPLFIILILSYLQILETNPLLVILFENIFSHSVDCLFILFLVSFAMQKMLSLIRSYLFIFVSIFITRGDISVKLLLQYVKECSSYVFLYEFYSSDFTFRSLNQFEFMYDVKGEKAMAPHSSILLPGKSHGQRSLLGFSPWGG